MTTMMMMETPKKSENQMYCESAEWLNLLEQARNSVMKDYTIIYRETDGTLAENWHFTTEMNFEYLKEKYKKQKKEIVMFVPKLLPYGEYLKTITGSSLDSL
jgi:hypothetical protein